MHDAFISYSETYDDVWCIHTVWHNVQYCTLDRHQTANGAGRGAPISKRQTEQVTGQSYRVVHYSMLYGPVVPCVSLLDDVWQIDKCGLYGAGIP
jgi:hypothetical protein